MSQNKKVTIITVSFNSEKTILNCINSVNNQKYSNIEHILIDGGSKDKTVDIFRQNSKFSGAIISEKDKGIYNAMNKGIKLSNGEIIGFLNSDDFFYSETSIDLIVQEFYSDIDCVFGNLLYVNSNNKIIRNWISRPFKFGLFRKSWSPAHPTFYCSKEIFSKYGGFREDLTITSDIELMLRFLEVNRIKSKFIDYYLVVMLEGGISNGSINSTLTISKEVMKSHNRLKLRFNLFIYLFFKICKILKQKQIRTNYYSGQTQFKGKEIL